MEPNYFVCTLGQAAVSKQATVPYRTISEFLSHQSKHCGSAPAVGFPIPHLGHDWGYEVFSFEDINQRAHLFACRLSETFGLAGQAPQTVALLSHSSPEFIFTWLGLIRLGHSVLLVAPQCQPAAILHLCESCNVSLLIYDISHSLRAKETVALQDEQGGPNLVRGLIPSQEVENAVLPLDSVLPFPQTDEAGVAYLHHTSGTSTGLPKPIPQSHRAAIGVLPHLPEKPSRATFTTTPLYHGGIADAFRAWTSDSMIWLFPAKDVQITARNICKCLKVAETQSSIGKCPRVGYFSSVPYVLQMMEADAEGLEALKSMDIVGVGGAALPAEVGNRLVNEDINLTSRFGSAECGFLLSSYRNFAMDKEWQYLRNHNPQQFLDFENRDDSLFELVVKPGWPHMAKTNLEDGSFATADLFAKHTSIENAWFYHSRADSQLTLITGKKFDPAPLEAAIATSDLVDDVLIFGNGKPYPGALIIRSARSSETSNEELLAAIWPSIESLNKESQDHARIPRHMLIAVRHQSEQLQKSSKGTIIRKAAEARFEDHINAAYDLEDDGTGETVDDADIPQHLIGLIPSIVSSTAPLDQDTDLFSYGVDSVACIQLRSRLRQLNSRYNQELPLSVVEDCGTVRGLADYIVRKRHGEGDATTEDQEQLMLDLVKEYSSFTKRGFAGKQSTTGLGTDVSSRDVVVLTGATGALGVHVLDLLRKSGTVSVIYCLVRGADELTATERVSKALEQRGLPGLFSKGNSSNKVRIIRAQLGGPRLGLTSTVYNQLAAEATLILHVAWTVNFRLKLKSFAKDNLAGLKNLIDLALAIPRACPPRLAYCSSTAAIMNGELNKSGYLAESLSQDPASASALGYSRSKWVAEQICAQAHSQTPLQGRIAIIRVGQLSGDSKTGIWNTKEAWPMMLSTARLIGCLPDLSDEPLDWLPVDRAAKAFLEAACVESDHTEQVPVYHVLNPHQQPTWHNMLQWIRRSEKFDIVDPTVWVRRLEHSSHTEHSAMKLLSLWKTTYDSGKSQEMQARPRFSIATTQQQVLALKDIQPLDEVYIWKVWEWVQDNVR